MHRILLPILLFLAPIAAHAAPHRVFIAGDSTAAEYGPERAPVPERAGHYRAVRARFEELYGAAVAS